MRPAFSRMMVSTARSMEPRCTGMCGALATSKPSAANTAHALAGKTLLAGKDGRLAPFAVRVEPRVPRGRGQRLVRRRQQRLAELGAAADRLDRHRLDHQLLRLVDESEARFVRGLEGGF